MKSCSVFILSESKFQVTSLKSLDKLSLFFNKTDPKQHSQNVIYKEIYHLNKCL